MSWSLFLENYAGQHLKADLLLPEGAAWLRVGSVLDQTGTASSFIAAQRF